jgi:hypothetical protein
MRKQRKTGSRHPLLPYRRSIGRLLPATLLAGLLLALLWGWEFFGSDPILTPEGDFWLLLSAAGMLGFTLLAFLGRFLAYAQPRRDHLLVATPFFRLRVSYRRVRSVHPAGLAQLFPPDRLSGPQRSALSPFYGMTAVVVELNSLPLSPELIRLFLGFHVLYRQATGLVLIVPDWIQFSTEMDSLLGAWQQTQGRQRPAPGQLR